MQKKLKRLSAIIAGISLIILGAVLLFLPGPGIALIVAGVFLISPNHGKKIWQRFLDWKKQTIDPRLSRFRKK